MINTRELHMEKREDSLEMNIVYRKLLILGNKKDLFILYPIQFK